LSIIYFSSHRQQQSKELWLDMIMIDHGETRLTVYSYWRSNDVIFIFSLVCMMQKHGGWHAKGP
jgi:hypothetical protein